VVAVLQRGQRVVVLAGLQALNQRVHRLQGLQVGIHPQAPEALEDQQPRDVGLPPPLMSMGGPAALSAVELGSGVVLELGQEPRFIPDLEGPPGVKLGPSLPEPDVLRGDRGTVPPPVNDPGNRYACHVPHRTGPAVTGGWPARPRGDRGTWGTSADLLPRNTHPGFITRACARV